MHCVQAVAGQLVGAQVLHVIAAEHPDEDVVVLAAEHPDEEVVVVDDVVGALAGQPGDTEVLVVVAIGVAVIVVELEDVCAATPATPTIEIATAAATKKTTIFFMTLPPSFSVNSTLRTTILSAFAGIALLL